MTRKKTVETTFFTDLSLPFPSITKFYSIENALSAFEKKYSKVIQKLKIDEIQKKIGNKIFDTKNKSDNHFLFALNKKAHEDTAENDNWSCLLSGTSFCTENENIANNGNYDFKNNKADNKNTLKQEKIQKNEEEQIVIRRRKKKDTKKKQKSIKYEESNEENIFEQNMEEETLEYLKIKYGQEERNFEESYERDCKNKAKKAEIKQEW